MRIFFHWSSRRWDYGSGNGGFITSFQSTRWL